MQAQADVAGLIRVLQGDDAERRKRAAAALLALDARMATSALRDALHNETDSDTRAHILAALEGLTDEAELEDLPPPEETLLKRMTEKLHDKDPQQVILAAKTLGELGNKLAVESLVMLFKDSKVSIQVRLAVAEALLKLDSAPVEVALLANLRHADSHIRRSGAAILGHIKAEWAIDPLAKALRDPHPLVRRTARAALKNIGTPEARRALAHGTFPSIPENRPPKPEPRTGDATVPIAPRHGLLRYIQTDDDSEDETDASENDTGNGGNQPETRSDEQQPHMLPTRPLDPSQVEELEARLKRKLEPPQDSSE